MGRLSVQGRGKVVCPGTWEGCLSRDVGRLSVQGCVKNCCWPHAHYLGLGAKVRAQDRTDDRARDKDKLGLREGLG